MTDVTELIENLGDEAVLMDGFDDCIIGVLERFGMDSIVLYDKQKVIEKLMKESSAPDELGDLAMEQALEYYEYNMLGSWIGERTPGFVIVTLP
jgi:hypothetical protein